MEAIKRCGVGKTGVAMRGTLGFFSWVDLWLIFTFRRAEAASEERRATGKFKPQYLAEEIL